MSVTDNRMIEFLHAYGEARLGDDWWPGMARHYLSAAQIAEYADVLAEVDPDYTESGTELPYTEWLRGVEA